LDEGDVREDYEVEFVGVGNDTLDKTDFGDDSFTGGGWCGVNEVAALVEGDEGETIKLPLEKGFYAEFVFVDIDDFRWDTKLQ